jgi:hypothetical protein
MANRSRQPTEAVRMAIGCAVLAARADGVPWKALEGGYGRGRVQLWRYAWGAKKSGFMANETSLQMTSDSAIGLAAAA